MVSNENIIRSCQSGLFLACEWSYTSVGCCAFRVQREITCKVCNFWEVLIPYPQSGEKGLRISEIFVVFLCFTWWPQCDIFFFFSVFTYKIKIKRFFKIFDGSVTSMCILLSSCSHNYHYFLCSFYADIWELIYFQVLICKSNLSFFKLISFTNVRDAKLWLLISDTIFFKIIMWKYSSYLLWILYRICSCLYYWNSALDYIFIYVYSRKK